ncbi:MAG: efflux RND transporter periplasmic adaptor subunit [Micavibrio sp.]|nr:efflux RND transporter periplasmic adaptor subunit [Micavibrio sp.]
MFAKGSYVDPGDNNNTILTLQDFSQVWIEAHVPIRDLQFLSVGTPATITVSGTGEAYKANVDFIYPETDLQNRKGMARLVLDNPEGRLKPNMPVDVIFAANVEPRLAVPEEAVLYDQRGAHVIATGDDGHFQPVMVKTGITSEGLTEITSGLSEGQVVVTSGQFMIDAESNLRGGIENMTGMNMESGHDQ